MDEEARSPEEGGGLERTMTPSDYPLYDDPRMTEDGEFLESDDDDFDDDALPPDHPAMRRIQEAIQKQLNERLQEVTADLREKEAQLKTAAESRENVGVRLYENQQQLAKLQSSLEKEQETYRDAVDQRTDLEKAYEKMKAQMEEVSAALKEKQKDAAGVQQEYDDLNKKILLFEKHALELESKVKGAKRAASKAAKQQEQLEERKQSQDEYVDRLRERAKDLEREITIAKKQLEAQREDTEEARTDLRDAQMEIDEIALRKRELHQLWQQSINGLGKRNEALSNMQVASREVQQEVFAKEREVEGVERNIVAEQEKNETLISQLNRLEAEIEIAKKKIQTITQQQDEVKKQYVIVTKALQDTEERLTRKTQEANIQQSEIKQAIDKQDRLAKEKVTREETIVDLMQGKLTVDNASRGAAKEIQQLREKVSHSEEILAEIEGKAAKCQVEKHAAKEKLKQFEAERDQLLGDAKALDSEMESYQGDIKSSYVTIERNQAKIDQMNKKIGVLKERLHAEGAGDEDSSPQQIYIYNIRQDITRQAQENGELQQQWLSHQSRLVAKQQEIETKNTTSADLRQRVIILREQQFRFNKEIEGHEKELTSQERNFKALQKELLKLNALIAKHRGAQEDLQQTNILMQDDFTRQLKQEERESIELEAKIDELENERERLLDAVVEAERQLLLWEKKIKLLQETRAELNSNEGKDELDGMRSEIHRMELKLQSLKREKEEVIQEMELTVARRGDMGSKARLMAKTGKNHAHQAKKKSVELKSRVKRAKHDIHQCQSDIAMSQDQIQNLESLLDTRAHNIGQLRDSLYEMDDVVKLMEQQRITNLDDIVDAQALSKHLIKVSKGTYKPLLKNPDKYNGAIEKQFSSMHTLMSIIGYIVEEYPHLASSFEPIRNALDARQQKFRALYPAFAGSHANVGSSDSDKDVTDSAPSDSGWETQANNAPNSDA